MSVASATIQMEKLLEKQRGKQSEIEKQENCTNA